ncbi:MAG TPA: hypothetical protein VK155_14810 [Bacteroidales bacterium]|jgi:hypothetical protein|nr:hypothetical protein [Bacteroidales bacterium]
MDYKEIKQLFNFLESNRKNLTSLQQEFIDSLRQHYRITGILTSVQTESLNNLKEKINSYENVPDQEFVSGLYGQLIENYC